MQEKTIFQKIIDRDIPATIVYEDELSIAFLDISPVSKGHVLLITKEPYRWMTDVPSNSIGAMFERAQKIMRAQITGLGVDFVQVGVVGKDVPHFHIHLIPQNLIDRDIRMDHTHYENEEEQHSYAERIKQAISST